MRGRSRYFWISVLASAMALSGFALATPLPAAAIIAGGGGPTGGPPTGGGPGQAQGGPGYVCWSPTGASIGTCISAACVVAGQVPLSADGTDNGWTYDQWNLRHPGTRPHYWACGPPGNMWVSPPGYCGVNVGSEPGNGSIALTDQSTGRPVSDKALVLHPIYARIVVRQDVWSASASAHCSNGVTYTYNITWYWAPNNISWYWEDPPGAQGLPTGPVAAPNFTWTSWNQPENTHIYRFVEPSHNRIEADRAIAADCKVYNTDQQEFVPTQCYLDTGLPAPGGSTFHDIIHYFSPQQPRFGIYQIESLPFFLTAIAPPPPPPPAPPAPPPPPPPPNHNRGSILAGGSTLKPGDYLESQDGSLRLVMQTDGNLVVYQNGTPIWASKTFGAGNFLAMQNDGNLVIYSASGKALKGPGTSGHPGAYLELKPQSNASGLYGMWVIRNGQGVPSGSAPSCPQVKSGPCWPSWGTGGQV